MIATITISTGLPPCFDRAPLRPMNWTSRVRRLRRLASIANDSPVGPRAMTT
jgi:hypothetical protein